jgi:hypothetical protein
MTPMGVFYAIFDESFDLPRVFLDAEYESAVIFFLNLGNMVKNGLKTDLFLAS